MPNYKIEIDTNKAARIMVLLNDPDAVAYKDVLAGDGQKIIFKMPSLRRIIALGQENEFQETQIYGFVLPILTEEAVNTIEAPRAGLTPEAIIAGFITNVNSGVAPLSITFTNKSTGPIDSYFWDFGDGTTSTEQNPTHVYTTAGAYTISLTALNLTTTARSTKNSLISVSAQVALPVAGFTSDKTSGTTPLTVQFTDQSIGTITSRLWDFGDGTTSIEQNPTHIYTTVGSFTVSLTVSNPSGSDIETKTNLINVSVTIPSLIEGGGFYVGDLGGYRIICAPTEGQTYTTWGPRTLASGADSLTDGYQNTLDLTSNTQVYPAADFCINLTIGGFTDWYLPSKEELNLLYQNHSALEAAGAGTFPGGGMEHWSSTEITSNSAYIQLFENGAQTGSFKDGTSCVRAIRRLPLV